MSKPCSTFVLLLATLLMSIGCGSNHAPAAVTAAQTSTTTVTATAAATDDRSPTVDAMLQLPKTPPDEALLLRVGQRVLLPTRGPAEQWQLDYDPLYWQRDPNGNDNLLIAARAGSTDLVQRQRPSASGAPAMRLFRYSFQISP